ncbi:hypothetical protein X975_08260, partial [Stegodyphus mimosarum]
MRQQSFNRLVYKLGMNTVNISQLTKVTNNKCYICSPLSPTFTILNGRCNH